MPITFGSVGDIISLCGLIRSIVKALDDTRGSAREYQDLVQELRALETAMQEVKRLSDENSNVLELGPLFQTAGQGAAQCQHDLEGFLESISKYGKYLQKRGSGSVIKDNIAKAKWQITHRDELVKYRAHISAHARSMNILLSAININVAFVHKAQLERSMSETRKASEDTIAEQRNIFRSIRSWCQRCEGYFAEATRLLRDTAQNVFQGMEWVRHATSDIKESVRQIFVLNFQMYGEILRVQSFMTTYLERAPSMASEAPWILDDCIGRVSPVHKQFIISWEAFQSVLENRFRGLPGYNKIRRLEYVLQDVESGDFVKREALWELAFSPGNRYSMSILFDDRDDTVEAQAASCPNCQYITQEASEAETKCTRCGIFFQRIVEESDDSENDVERPLCPGQKVIGPRVERKAKRRKYRPWFSGKKTGKPKGLPQTPSKRSRKRRWDDFESSESEPDHASFKRIRLVSPKHYLDSQHRKKRVRLYGTTKLGEAQTPTLGSKVAQKSGVLTNEQGSKTGEPDAEETSSDLQELTQKPRAVYGDSLVQGESNGSDSETDYFSLDSQITDYEYFCGRRYHAYGTAYLRPNDDRESDTEDMLHHIFLLLLNERLYLAPLPPAPEKILDVGTGTGIWAIEVADELSSSTVEGMDNCPIQPAFVPPNAIFTIDDIFLTGGAADWDRKPQYDFVHIRNLCTATKDWRALIDGAYRSLHPGGFLEVQELIPFPFTDANDTNDGNSTPDMQMSQYIRDAYAAYGIDLEAPLRISDVLQEAGFEDVKAKVIRIGRESKEIYRRMIYWFKEALDGLTNKPFQQGLGWSDKKRKLYMTKFFRSWLPHAAAERRTYFKFIIVYGRKR